MKTKKALASGSYETVKQYVGHMEAYSKVSMKQ